jgi:hypothetical protein
MKRMQNPTVSKGYRLKTSTHRMIRKIQNILGCTQDSAIGRAVQMYYAEIQKFNSKSNKFIGESK